MTKNKPGRSSRPSGLCTCLVLSSDSRSVEDEVFADEVVSRFMRKIVCRLRPNEVSRQ
nr:MAG TPA: hypothetical protein [Caudoviricetes sp.]